MSWVASAGLALTVYTGSQASKSQNALSEANHESAVTSMTYENRGINEGLREDQAIAADKKLEMMKQALKAQSTLQARGRSVSGADGQSKEISNNLGHAISQINATLEGRSRQAEMEKRGTSARAESRINSVPKTSFNPMADVAQAGLSIYGGYKDAQRQYSADTGGKGDLEFSEYFWGDYQ